MARKTAIVVEISANGNLATFHFRSKNPIGVTTSPLKRSGYRTDNNYVRWLSIEGKNLVTELFAVPGVMEIVVCQYEVGVFMGKAYSVEEIIPRVAALLATLFYCHEDSAIDVTVEHIGGIMHTPIRPIEFRAGAEARLDLERIMHK